MADTQQTQAAPAPEAAKVKKVFCFVSKREVAEAEAIEMPYTNGQRVWVHKDFVKFPLSH